MKTVLALLCIVITSIANAQDNFVTVLGTITDTAGRTKQFRTDSKTLAASPAWTPGTAEPPLSVAAALRAATPAAKRAMGKAFDGSLNSIALTRTTTFKMTASGPVRFERWYYSVVFRGGAGETDIAVLMDGTVIETSPTQ